MLDGTSHDITGSDLVAGVLGDKPRLLIETCDPDVTVAALRDKLAGRSQLFERGGIVRLALDQIQGGMIAQLVTPEALVMEAHGVCRPYRVREGKHGPVEVNARLPTDLAVMYLGWRGQWRLPPLNGIAAAPLLEGNGTIHSEPAHTNDC